MIYLNAILRVINDILLLLLLLLGCRRVFISVSAL